MILLFFIPALPLLASVLILTMLRKDGQKSAVAGVIATAFTLALLPFLFGKNVSSSVPWLQLNHYQLTIGLSLDMLSFIFISVISIVSLFVQIYAIGYMKEETGKIRFFSIFSFFIGSMMLLVLANSFLLLFVAWEAVSVASFLLISFYLTREESKRAALTAFIMIRVADVALFVAWLLVLLQTGTTNIPTFLNAVATGQFASGMLIVITVFFVIGALGKSAQLPFSSWLPGAMVAPTPVSALLHSATMVVAGVYLLLRLFPLFTAVPVASQIILWIGLVTALVGAIIATGQMHMKRVLAWSTISQIGEMILAIGSGSIIAAMFHFITQAFFKSTLFLTAGSIDKAAGTLELEKLKGFGRALPILAIPFLLSTLALAGIPPFSGFFSEEAILASVAKNTPALILFLITLFLAGLYIGRVATAVFLSKPTHKFNNASLPFFMTYPTLILSFGAADIGLVLKPILLLLLPSQNETLSLLLRLISVGTSISGLAIGFIYVKFFGLKNPLGRVQQIVERVVLGVPNITVQAVQSIGTLLVNLEQLFDDLVRLLVSQTFVLVEKLQPVEVAFDDGALKFATNTFTLSQITDKAENIWFSNPVDTLGNTIMLAGIRLKPLQQGKTYNYLSAILLWTVLILGASAFLLIIISVIR